MKLQLSKKERRTLIRICVTLAAFIVVFAVDRSVGIARSIGGKFGWLAPFFIYLAIYLAISYDILFRAARNICHGQIFDENFLMCIASLGAFALAIFRGVRGLETEGFEEACAVMLFYQTGEFFQRYAVGKSRRSISAILDIRPDSANVMREGKVENVFPDEVHIGDVISVEPGERVPLDGVCVMGVSALDTSALTGESLPKDVAVGDTVLSGCINLSSELRVKVTKEYHDSTASKILDLVENASDKKSKAENFITKFARIYTPVVVFTALALAIIPGAVTGDWETWIYRALSFLVVSCPCALVISVPLTFFAGIGAASRYGILVKGSDFLEKFNKTDIFVFDKTGTLTKGNFAVLQVWPEDKRDEILRYAAVAEQNSSHPIAKSIMRAYAEDVDEGYMLTNVAGKGVIASKSNCEIAVGNEKLMLDTGVTYAPVNGAVHVAKDGQYQGYILLGDELKDDAPQVVSQLNAFGARTIMLTGDSEEVAEDIAKRIGVREYKASLLPADKVDEVEKLLSTKRRSQTLCFVGDGINDAPVLMRADIGIAMGGVGSDAAIEASDIVLMHDQLDGIPLAKRVARRTMRVARENIIFSLGIKAAILILSALGIASMWLAVFGDVGVAIIAILNALRVGFKYKTASHTKA